MSDTPRISYLTLLMEANLQQSFGACRQKS